MPRGNNPEQLIGSVIAHRFSVEHLAAKAVLASAFKARDITDNRPVARKLLHRQSATSGAPSRAAGFRSPAVRAFGDPSIVSYVAHGQTQRRPALPGDWSG